MESREDTNMEAPRLEVPKLEALIAEANIQAITRPQDEHFYSILIGAVTKMSAYIKSLPTPGTAIEAIHSMAVQARVRGKMLDPALVLAAIEGANSHQNIDLIPPHKQSVYDFLSLLRNKQISDFVYGIMCYELGRQAKKRSNNE